MLALNKYLKEVGIDENYWLFDKETKQIDNRYNPDEDGFVDAEFFNLDTTLAMVNYSYLRYFRENCMYGSPNGISFEDWKNIIDKMINAFELIIKDNEIDYLVSEKERIKQNKNRDKKIKYGLRLYAKYFFDLWY